MYNSLFIKLSVTLTITFIVLLAALYHSMSLMLSDEALKALLITLAICMLAFLLFIGVLVSYVITNRLKTLAIAMENFQKSDFCVPSHIQNANPNGDEIDRLGNVFNMMQLRMMEQLQNLQHVNTQRRELLANVSHDLRTPLASMRGYLETLLLKEGLLTPENRQYYLEVAVKQSERLSRMVGDLFQLTKLDANEIIPNKESFSLSDLVQDVIQKFLLQAEKCGVRLEVNFYDRLPMVNADIGLIERVLENLIENALRYTSKAGVVRVQMEHREGRVFISVSDTGVGIDESKLDKIFDRYYRADRSNESDSGHAGLGLAISQRVALLHGGNMTVESNRGVGTKFTFDLPVVA